MTDIPSCPPLADTEWPESVSDMRKGFAGGLNVYRTMAHHPALLRAWAPLREHVVNQTALGPDFSEVAILRTGLRLGSSYEKNQHIDRARKRGFSDERIAAVLGALGGMSAEDRLIAGGVDELIESHALSEATAREIAESLGKEAVFDLMATVGFYSTLGFILNTFDTPLDDNIAERLSAEPFSAN